MTEKRLYIRGEFRMKKTFVFCIPFAGGSVGSYVDIFRGIKNAEVKLIELSGHGGRYNEGLYDYFFQAVDDIYQYIYENMEEDRDYAIFGHSMGALIAYEVYYKLFENNVKLPKYLFLSGCKAPGLERNERNYKLSDNELIEKIRDMNGTQQEILRHPEFRIYFLPIIRADYKLIENYKHVQKSSKIQVPTIIFYGDKDEIKEEDIISWSDYTQEKPEFFRFTGGHFFIYDHSQEILEIISGLL